MEQLRAPRPVAPELGFGSGDEPARPARERRKPGRIATIAGIDIHLHWSFGLLLAWIFFAHYSAGHSLAMALQGVGFVATIFGCVVLHELGHALTARRFGFKTRDITLYPIGGVARLERMPERPLEEFLVAIAGPAVNFVIAGLLWLVIDVLPAPDRIPLVGGPLLGKVMYVNLSLGLFNLLPAFPMDGGRVLRAALAARLGYVRATQLAASAGKVLSIGLGLLGLFGNSFLLFIALFVFVAAQQEAVLVQTRAVLSGVPVTAAMLTRFAVVEASHSIAQVLELLSRTEQEDFPVLREGKLAGVLTRKDLLRALAAGQTEARVEDVMTATCEVADASEMLDSAFMRMQQAGCTSLPVTQRGELVGMLTLEHVGRWLMLRGALGRKPPQAHG